MATPSGSRRFESMADPLVDSNRPPHRVPVGPVQPASPIRFSKL
ncbi:hypothetical protein MtrunA17_Chr3g0085041 [Medicago truncatula]|uniref:Uncharacterized protein n=1 Tax=Medicago truncatula TaxID=3880 RepID=A0A396IKX5_MEDTR|nr:hypothetical protein MtrunA17_Chr3g0085041 [Medicago truncatula]